MRYLMMMGGKATTVESERGISTLIRDTLMSKDLYPDHNWDIQANERGQIIGHVWIGDGPKRKVAILPKPELHFVRNNPGYGCGVILTATFPYTRNEHGIKGNYPKEILFCYGYVNGDIKITGFNGDRVEKRAILHVLNEKCKGDLPWDGRNL